MHGRINEMDIACSCSSESVWRRLKLDLQLKPFNFLPSPADNILLRNGCTYIALTDFGTSRRLCDPKELMHKSPVGSPAHWSPEKAASQGHGFPSDLWAALCVLIHMLSGDPPWMRRFMKSATILNFIVSDNSTVTGSRDISCKFG